MKKGLNESEVESLLDFLGATREHHSLIIQLLILSGIRTHELWDLKIKDLDLVQNKLTLWKGAKGSNGRVVGLPKWYVSRARGKVFESGMIGDSRLVDALGYDFGGGTVQSFKASLRRSWQVIKRKVFGGTIKLGLHSLRHTYAIKAYRIDRDILMVQRLLGHKSLSSTEKYLPYADEDKQINFSRGLYETK